MSNKGTSKKVIRSANFTRGNEVSFGKLKTVRRRGKINILNNCTVGPRLVNNILILTESPGF